jgi:hypothetical protein
MLSAQSLLHAGGKIGNAEELLRRALECFRDLRLLGYTAPSGDILSQIRWEE